MDIRLYEFFIERIGTKGSCAFTAWGESALEMDLFEFFKDKKIVTLKSDTFVVDYFPGHGRGMWEVPPSVTVTRIGAEQTTHHELITNEEDEGGEHTKGEGPTISIKKRRKVRESLVTQRIMEEVQRERNYQRLKGFDDELDQSHTKNDWVALIVSYAGKAANTERNTKNHESFQANMLKIMALAQAALEAYCKWEEDE